MTILKEDWISPKIEIRDTLDKGKGMFAIEEIKEGEKVVVWGGEYTDKDRAEQAKAQGKHVMQWDDDLFSVEI